MPTCASCEFFGIKGASTEWCFHKYKNWSTSGYNKACEYYKSKW